MPISYSDITYIENGQAINASNLNAPSVDLAARTIEVKRVYDQQTFSQQHTTDTDVVLVSSSPQNSSIVIKSELKQDGSAASNLVKYYLPEFNNIKFSIYSKSVHGGRYIIDGADVGSLFSNSINGSNSVYSTALTVPGDGIYAKIPLRHTGEAESLPNYPDLVYPKSKVQSLGDGYLTSGISAELVKLPELVIMDFLSATEGESVSTFISRLQTQFTDIDSITVSSEGLLQILDVNQQPLTIRITGTQEGAECVVTHLLERQDSEPGFIAKFSRASSPIYIEHQARITTTSIGIGLFRDAVYLDSSLAPISAGNYLGYFILPSLLDPNYSYVPLLKLTENSLLVADRTISLTTKILPNGDIINSHGDPILGVPSSFSVEEVSEYTVNILTDQRTNLGYKKSYSVDIGNHEVNSNTTAIDSDDIEPVDISHLKSVIQVGDVVQVSGVSILVTDTFVSSVANPEWYVSASVGIDSVISSSSVYTSSTPTVGDVIELSFATPITISAQVLDFYLRIVGSSSSNGDLLSGGLSATFNFRVI